MNDWKSIDFDYDIAKARALIDRNHDDPRASEAPVTLARDALVRAGWQAEASIYELVEDAWEGFLVWQGQRIGIAGQHAGPADASHGANEWGKCEMTLWHAPKRTLIDRLLGRNKPDSILEASAKSEAWAILARTPGIRDLRAGGSA